jgi:hypothetical protein
MDRSLSFWVCWGLEKWAGIDALVSWRVKFLGGRLPRGAEFVLFEHRLQILCRQSPKCDAVEIRPGLDFLVLMLSVSHHHIFLLLDKPKEGAFASFLWASILIA